MEAMLVWQNLETLMLSLFGAGVAMVAGLVAHLAMARDGYLGYKQRLATSERIPLAPYSVNASWITSGSPVFRSNTFGSSHDNSTSSGLWECIGPGGFTWHYGTDESIFILEGSAEVEYLGKKFTLAAGDCTHFVAGTTANWVVAERVKKSFTLYEPGRFVRKMRRIFGLFHKGNLQH